MKLTMLCGCFLAAGITVCAAQTLTSSPASWSKEIGTLTSPASKAIVTAVSTLNGATTTRGVRIDLRHLQPNPNCMLKVGAWARMCALPDAGLFIEHTLLPLVIDALDPRSSISRPGLPAYADDSSCGPISEYRGGSPQAGNTTTGLIICGYTFEGRSAMEFSSLLSLARAELDRASRRTLEVLKVMKGFWEKRSSL